MSTVSLVIDGKNLVANRGESLLRVALDNGIYIPNLCALRDKKEPAGACRLCFVEIAGKRRPVTACTEKVTEGMVVNTRGEQSLKLARSTFELMMASHPIECATCVVNGVCELQKIARHLGARLKSKRFRRLLKELPLDSSHPLFTYDPNKCVLCGRCVWVCKQGTNEGILGFACRGFQRLVTTFASQPLGEYTCQGCGECVKVCPAGALVFKNLEGLKTKPGIYQPAR